MFHQLLTVLMWVVVLAWSADESDAVMAVDSVVQLAADLGCWWVVLMVVGWALDLDFRWVALIILTLVIPLFAGSGIKYPLYIKIY